MDPTYTTASDEPGWGTVGPSERSGRVRDPVRVHVSYHVSADLQGTMEYAEDVYFLSL